MVKRKKENIILIFIIISGNNKLQTKETISRSLDVVAGVELIGIIVAKSLQSCPTLCDPTDGSPPGSPVPGILQARTLEWVAISFSNA